MFFLGRNSEAAHAFFRFAKKIQNGKGYHITKITNDHGGEFENEWFEDLCGDQGI